MASVEVDSGLFSINLSDSEDGDAGASGCGSGGAAARDRKGQTEAEYQAVKATYRPKVENGEVKKASISPFSFSFPHHPPLLFPIFFPVVNPIHNLRIS